MLDRGSSGLKSDVGMLGEEEAEVRKGRSELSS